MTEAEARSRVEKIRVATVEHAGDGDAHKMEDSLYEDFIQGIDNPVARIILETKKMDMNRWYE